ncbi:MBL fold metallo-hydrolase [Carboxylicivirga sp. RSCT41]|uniref:MBL fold metallo-hydrolase n=1 Tax=Carboxylicivirga agarovorans TaxID=3417570 RepID=UPI003D32D319
MKLTALIDNKQDVKQLKCEHGLSFLLETENRVILFDTGQSDKFIHNAKVLNIDLSRVDYAVISHGHYDHAGGLPAFLKMNSKAQVFIHREAFKKRFSRSSAMVKENGIPWRNQLGQYSDRITLLDDDLLVEPGLQLMGSIKARTGYEIVNDRLVVEDDQAFKPDTFDDELVLIASESNKNLVLAGCAHTGIVNILHAAEERYDHSSFDCVAGGLHLNGQQVNDVDSIIEAVKGFDVKKWAIDHCTGDLAFEQFSNAFHERVVYFGTGAQLSI